MVRLEKYIGETTIKNLKMASRRFLANIIQREKEGAFEYLKYNELKYKKLGTQEYNNAEEAIEYLSLIHI